MVLLTRKSNKYGSVYYFLVSLILVTFPFPINAQEVNTKPEGELQDILKGLEEADSGKLETIYNLDVLGYFNLGDDYDTELKMKVFKKTPEYAKKLSELKKMKTEIFSTEYYLKLHGKFYDTQYDVKKKGFSISLDGNMGECLSQAHPPKSVNNFLLSSLPTKNIYIGLVRGVYVEHLFLPMNEEKGLEIENSREKFTIYLIFKISGKENVRYKFNCGYRDI